MILQDDYSRTAHVAASTKRVIELFIIKVPPVYQGAKLINFLSAKMDWMFLGQTHFCHYISLM
ncbi:hypothetical protein A8C75_06695 [Marinobacterium aestuarii]|uniref:Uncharacterized protein n=1 Tax=Marinobacterium aestuarii TaxID=1821621 RepID=A0A1A9EWT1_9GAMM|nr:hypothetical protein A8C75_06695 [Marinobacterium aestuarii]